MYKKICFFLGCCALVTKENIHSVSVSWMSSCSRVSFSNEIHFESRQITTTSGVIVAFIVLLLSVLNISIQIQQLVSINNYQLIWCVYVCERASVIVFFVKYFVIISRAICCLFFIKNCRDLKSCKIK